MWFWAWNMRNVPNWCGTTTYYVMYLQLSRVYDCMLNDSHLVWNSNPNTKGMRRLAEARDLCFDLYGDNYNKWLQWLFRTHKPAVEKNGELYSRLEREGKPIPKKLYYFYLKKANEKDAKEYANKRQRLFTLLDKYIDSWWD